MGNVTVNKILHAIKNTYEVTINYKSKGEDNATGDRLIQPVAYGLTKKNRPVIRAFQPEGDTLSKTPSWKFFRADRIIGWKPHKDRIFPEPPDTHIANGNFNPNGDKTMEIVYNIAKFPKKEDDIDISDYNDMIDDEEDNETFIDNQINTNKNDLLKQTEKFIKKNKKRNPHIKSNMDNIIKQLKTHQDLSDNLSDKYKEDDEGNNNIDSGPIMKGDNKKITPLTNIEKKGEEFKTVNDISNDIDDENEKFNESKINNYQFNTSRDILNSLLLK